MNSEQEASKGRIVALPLYDGYSLVTKLREPTGPRLIDIHAVADYTGLSTHTLYKMTSNRKIPHVKLGGEGVFDLALLDEWIKKSTVLPMPQK